MIFRFLFLGIGGIVLIIFQRLGDGRVQNVDDLVIQRERHTQHKADHFVVDDEHGLCVILDQTVLQFESLSVKLLENERGMGILRPVGKFRGKGERHHGRGGGGGKILRKIGADIFKSADVCPVEEDEELPFFRKLVPVFFGKRQRYIRFGIGKLRRLFALVDLDENLALRFFKYDFIRRFLVFERGGGRRFKREVEAGKIGVLERELHGQIFRFGARVFSFGGIKPFQGEVALKRNAALPVNFKSQLGRVLVVLTHGSRIFSRKNAGGLIRDRRRFVRKSGYVRIERYPADRRRERRRKQES